jgi:phage terminase small subunit
MPRRTTADLSVVRVDGRPNRLLPPPDLGANARRLWVELVGANAPEHFKPSDRPLLQQYCETIAMAERAAQEMQATGGPVLADGTLSAWFSVRERCVRQMAVLANRLRLTPSARGGAKEAGRAAARHQVSYYDTMMLDEQA